MLARACVCVRACVRACVCVCVCVRVCVCACVRHLTLTIPAHRFGLMFKAIAKLSKTVNWINVLPVDVGFPVEHAAVCDNAACSVGGAGLMRESD